MYRKIVILSLFLFLLTLLGCTTAKDNIKDDNNNFIFSFSFNTIEEEDKIPIREWLISNKDKPIATYGSNNRNYYIYATNYNDATITRDKNTLIIKLKYSDNIERNTFY